MAPRRPREWPPAYAPKTTTSPTTQALLEDAQALLEGHVPVDASGMVRVDADSLKELLGEVRRLQEHESRLRQDLEGTFHLVRLLYSSRDLLRARLAAHEELEVDPTELTAAEATGLPGEPTGRHQEVSVVIGDDPPSRRKLTEADVARLRVFWDQVRRKDGTRPARDTDKERG